MKETRIWHPEKSINLGYKCGEGSVIHAMTWIAHDVTIGDNCKIQALTFIPDGVTIEDNVFIGPCVCFTNDKHPPSNGTGWSKTLVKEGVVIGANATILTGITIGERAIIGAGSVVTRNVPPGETWIGNPAYRYVVPVPRHYEDP